MSQPKLIGEILKEMQAEGKLPPGTISVNKKGTAGVITQILEDKDMPTCPTNHKIEIVSERKRHV